MSIARHTIHCITAWAALALAGAALTGCHREVELSLFDDVTPSSGLDSYAAMTHGSAWGDFDGDGRPDVYITNHLNTPLLFHNLGGGRFADVTADLFDQKQLEGDKHGTAWADFDNDGRQDLVQLTGAVKGLGAEPKRLFHNNGTRFSDVATEMGVLNPDGRTRMPLWIDLDHDGRIDLVQGAEARFDAKTPPFAFTQGNGGFTASEKLPFDARSVPFCVLAELTNDDTSDLLCRIVGKNRTAQAFDLSTQPANDLDLLPATAFEDVAVADFENDGRMDLFLARKNPPGSIAFGRAADTSFIADASIDEQHADKLMGFSFRTSGPLKVHVASANPRDAVSPERIHLGAQGAHPDGMSFDLSAAAPGITGIAPHTAGAQAGVYVGFTAPDRWDVRLTAPREALAQGNPKYQQIQLRVESTAPVEALEAVGEPPAVEEAPARLFMNRDGRFVEDGDKRGVNARLVAGMNVVAADFDNDMDVDLFVLASGDIGQQPNLLLLNDGTGHFDVVKNAGGAAGSMAGVGDSATTADVDGDGFLDLFLANGGSMGRSLGLPSDGGGYQLFRNVGNANHWLMIDLEGTKSNRDGIGALVRVTAGGVTQMRLQDGGVHHRSQNHSRLHVGLGGNTTIDKITVHWPSGTVQELSGIKADQVLHIKETE